MTQRMTPALGTSAAPTVTAFVLFFSLVLWILALRSDIHFSYSSHLPSGPSNIQSHTVLPPQACAYIPSVPSNPTLTTRTHTYYTAHTTHASIFFAFILFPSYCITVSSVVISICAPFFIPGSVRSFCPNYSFFLLPCSVLSVFPLRSCFCH